MRTIALLIPAYNAAVYLPRLLKSAHIQTVSFDEILVYDDGSTDDTSEIAVSYGAKVIRGEVNVGCSVGKNVLAERAGTEWIHFHDADDELMPHFVERARMWMHKPVDVVLFAYEERDDASGQHINFRRFDPRAVALDARAFAIREQINPFCGLYRRSAVLAAGGYDVDPSVLYNEDVAFHIRMAFAGLRFAADTEIVVINNRRMNSMSSANAHKCLSSQYAVMVKTLSQPGSEPYTHEIGRRMWELAGSFGSHLDWVRADEAVGLASKLCPPTAGSQAFRLACKLSPRLALRAREAFVRLTRPHLRPTSVQISPE